VGDRVSRRLGARSCKRTKQIEKKFRYPLFVKPAALGSSVGMSKVHSEKELAPALDLASEFAMKILVERAVSAREIEVSVLGNHDPKASIPGEIVPHREFYDYHREVSGRRNGADHSGKAEAGANQEIQALAVAAFRTLELLGMARVGFFSWRKKAASFT